MQVSYAHAQIAVVIAQILRHFLGQSRHEHALSVLAFADAARWFERALGLLETAAPLDAVRREWLSAKRIGARAHGA